MPDIDIVVMWVDGSDPDWLAEKSRFDKLGRSDSNGAFCFRDYGLMKYWFRAVETYIPWFRKIHFVTWGHLPAFLDTSHPKLNIVYHRDFMPEGTLPCFNSSALEMNLFRINGLSEHFIYFNDDMFVLRPLDQTDFFTEKGIPCCQFAEMPAIHKGPHGAWKMLYVNGMSIINQHFSKRECQRVNFFKYYNIKYRWYDNVRSLAMKYLFPDSFVGFKTYHVPAPFCKKTFKKIWEKEPDLMEKMSRHKFREYTDVNQWLAIWWQLAEGNFKPRRMDSMSIGIDNSTVDQVCEWIKGQTFEMFCINDNLDEKSFPAIMDRLQDAFETILPGKSSFEV